MWSNKIGKRIFFSTFLILFTTVSFFYMLVYFMLPSTYELYKQNKIQKLTDTISLEINNKNTIEVNDYFNDNIELMSLYTILIIDDHDILLFRRGFQIPMSQALFEKNPFFDSGINSESYIFDRNAVLQKNEKFIGEKTVNVNGKNATLFVTTPRSSVDEVGASLVVLLPYVFIMILFLAFFIGYISSKIFSRPLLILNNKARLISQMDFDNDLRVLERTELGELSDNLDLVSENLKLALTQLSNDKDRAIKREKERRTFVAIMSHELKTPLTILKGQNECMLENRGAYKNRDKYLYENIKIIQNIEDLVKNILLSSKIDDVDFILTAKEVEISSIIKSQVGNYDNIILQNNVEIILDIEETKISADKSIMTYIIKNIIENACFYSQENTKILIQLKDKVLKVTNECHDISNDDIEELFKPFKTTNESRNSSLSGHGLGLYIVKRGLNLHDFNFKFEKIDDKSVEFMINFNKTLHIRRDND